MDLLKSLRIPAAGAMVALLCATVAAPPARAEKEVTKEQVEAAYLYHFSQFVEWPGAAFSDANSPFVIGVLGRDPFGSVLDKALAGKTSGGRSIQIRRGANPADLMGCHIVFVSGSEMGRLNDVLKTFATKPILTVGEMSHFAHEGGAINFILVDKKVKFQVNQKAGEKAGLKFSSKLLSVGQIVS